MSQKRRLAAILSADVAGYSRLMAEDEQGTIQTLTAYRSLINSLVGDHHGRVVDSPGDNLLAEFPNALDAVQCAVEVQGVLRVRNQSLAENRRMLFRIGVHLGDITAEGDRIYGDGVNIAARLEGLAESGGVCISGAVHEQVRGKLEIGYVRPGRAGGQEHPRPGARVSSPVGIGWPRPGSTDENPAQDPRRGCPIGRPGDRRGNMEPLSVLRRHRDEPHRAHASRQALHRGPAFHEHERRPGAGVLQRRGSRRT